MKLDEIGRRQSAHYGLMSRINAELFRPKL
jgi:hypothetical protein